MSNTLQRHIEDFEKRSPRHHLAMLSGVQSGLLVRYKKGEIKRPGRNILLKICLALELGIEEISKILEEFGKDPIDQTDISYFKEAIRDRRVPPGIHPMKTETLGFEITIMSIENKSGNVKLVTSYPHRCFEQSVEHEIDIIGKGEVYRSIREQLLRLRKDNFKKTMFVTDHMICDGCFRESIKENKNNSELVALLNEMLETATNPEKKYNLNIIDICPYFLFHLKEPDEEVTTDNYPIVLFSGKRPTHEDESRAKTNPLFGFATTDKQICKDFSEEFDRLMESIIVKGDDPEGLKKYVMEIIKENKINM